MTGAWRWKQRFILLGICAACLVGCSTSAEDVRLPVAGTVLYDGKPLTSGTVILKPDAAKGNESKHEPRGKIDAEGKYQIETALRPGAPPGWYKVSVLAFEPQDPRSFAVPQSAIPTVYNDPDQASLFLEVVKEPAPGAYDIKLMPK